MRSMSSLTRSALTAGLGEDVGGFVRRELGRRVSTTRGRFVAATRPRRPNQPPILLVGCPRSGTTLLFDLLQHHPDLVSLADEGHSYWTAFNHPRRHGWRSDELTAADATSRERRYVETRLAGLGAGRPLDKTPKNVLRLPYLRALFPEATIVLVVRDGRATVASLLEAWRRRRGASYLLPESLRLRDYDSRLWRYVLPPDWRSLQGTDLATVATHQYVSCTAAATRDLALVDAMVRYEDLVADAVGETNRLLSQIGLPEDLGVRNYAARLPEHTRGSLSAPRPDKWLTVAADLGPHRDAIFTHASAFGYVDA